MKSLLMWLVRGYRLAISPLFPPRCRFLPSCSDYALQALERHGAIAGVWLALRRFLRCNPLNPGGIDEVPDNAGGWLAGFGAAPGAAGGRRWHGIGCLCGSKGQAPGNDPSHASESVDPTTGHRSVTR